MPRTIAVGSLAGALLAWNWLRLEDGGHGGQALLVVVLALVPALVPGVRRRAAAALVSFAVASASAFDLGLGWHFPGRLFSRFGRGFLDFYDVQLPFDPSSHPRMHGVLLLAVFAFALFVALAAAARRPGLASVGLVVGAGWPATLLPGHDLLRGAILLAGVLAVLLCLRPGPLRGLVPAAVAGAVVVLAALATSSSPAFAKRAFLDWQKWDFYNRPSKPVDVSYVWNSSYSGLTFPRKPTTVLRIQASPTPEYWRATVLNTVVAGHWREEAATQNFRPEVLGEDGLVPRRQKQQARWGKQDVKVEALRDHHLVGGSVPSFFEPSSQLGVVLYDPTGIAFAKDFPARGDSYEVWSYSPSPTPAQLARSKPAYAGPIISERKYREVETNVFPPLFGTPGRESRLRYLFTEYSRAPLIQPYRPLYSLAEQVAGGAESPYAATVALERWFRLGGGFFYDQHPPSPPAGVPPLVDFVTRTRQGYCQHFAGAMALMLRYLGIPSRVAAGFTSGRYDKGSGEWVVSDRDAHTWVEVWFRGWGWLPFDPTPDRSGLVGQYSASSPSFDVAATAAVLASPRGLRSFSPDLADRLGFGGQARVSPDVPDLRAPSPLLLSTSKHSRAWGLLRLLALGLAALAAAIMVAKLVVRRSRYLTRDPRRLAGACRRELRDFVLDQGVEVPSSATLRELAALVEEEFGVEAAAFGLHATAARFGPSTGAREAARATRRDLRSMRRGLRRELTRLERARGLVSLRSLGFAG